MSPGATSLYRRVMAPSLLKVFDEKPTPVKTINDEVEYHVPESGKAESKVRNLPPKYLHLPSQKVEFFADDYLDVGDVGAVSKVRFVYIEPTFRSVYVA